jgi:hypothetical protein
MFMGGQPKQSPNLYRGESGAEIFKHWGAKCEATNDDQQSTNGLGMA